MELRGDLVHVRLGDVHASLAARAGQEVAPLDQPPDLLDLFAMNRGRPAHDLETVVLGRIVAAGDHDGCGGLQVEHGIEIGRGHVSTPVTPYTTLLRSLRHESWKPRTRS